MKKILIGAFIALSVMSTSAFADYSCTVNSNSHSFTRSGHTYHEACERAMSACVYNTSHHDSCHVSSH